MMTLRQNIDDDMCESEQPLEKDDGMLEVQRWKVETSSCCLWHTSLFFLTGSAAILMLIKLQNIDSAARYTEVEMLQHYVL